jgi:hypothetical protein
MTENHGLTRRGVLALAGASALGVWTTSTPADGPGDTGLESEPTAIAGAWSATERHKSHGSLFQPNHEARKRDAVIYFEQDGDRLTGRSVTPDYKKTVGQGDWNGETRLEHVRFSDGKLVFEVTIVAWDQKLAPLSEDLNRKDHKGTIRVEAQLKGDKLVGKWGVFTQEGAEIYRGEWEAVRAERPDKK